jgi:excisionase family DNA binding protein
MEAIIERTSRQEQKTAIENLPKIKKLAASFAKRTEPVTIEVNDHDLVRLHLPAKLFAVLQEILDLMSKGKAFSLLPANAELTTQEAADILNVSRPFIVKLLEKGIIPFKNVGTHRRILLEDILIYATRMKSDREEGLKELARLGQKYNL